MAEILSILVPLLGFFGGWALGGLGLWRSKQCINECQALIAITLILGGLAIATVSGIAFGLRFMH